MSQTSPVLPSGATLLRDPDAGPTADRRLLLISYHFPPSGAAGALRWEKLSHFAAERGYGLDVVTVLPGNGSPEDADRLERLPASIRLVAVPDQEPLIPRLEKALARRRPWRRGQAGSAPAPRATPAPPRPSRPDSLGPDEIRWSATARGALRAWWYGWAWWREQRWATDAVRVARRLRDPRHVAVVTCGPPHRVHRVASTFARREGLPHIMDLRDPWGARRRLPEVVATPLVFALARPAERSSIAAAALVVANTEAMADDLRARHPSATGRILTVMNGFDDDDQAGRPAATDRSAPFTIVYAGTVYLDRNPRGFFEAMRRVVDRLNVRPGELRIDFIGPGSDSARLVAAEAADAGLSELVRILPRMPRGDVLGHLRTATVLLSLPQDSPYAVPSKVFEYLGFEAWSLAMATRESPTGRALAGTAAAVVDPADTDAIADRLAGWITAYREGRRPGPVAGRERLSRRRQAAVLFDALDRILAGGAP